MYRPIKVSREQRLYEYLAANTKSAILLTEVWHTWIRLKRLVEWGDRVLDVPEACPNDQLTAITLNWVRDNHSLECYFSIGKPPEFFYRDRLNGNVWGQVGTNGDTEQLKDILLLFSSKIQK